jgi:hypothetical protein
MVKRGRVCQYAGKTHKRGRVCQYAGKTHKRGRVCQYAGKTHKSKLSEESLRSTDNFLLIHLNDI